MSKYNGKKFNYLLIQKVFRKNNQQYAECLCDCGTIKDIRLYGVVDGNVKSCGCYHKIATIRRRTTHGMSKTPIFRIWQGLIQRCHNPNNRAFKNYGGRGIIVYDAWKSDFSAFYSHIKSTIGDRPSDKHELDRIDNSKGYEPNNLQWLTHQKQQWNKRTNRVFVINGEHIILSNLAKRLGLSFNCLRHRLNTWSLAKAISTPHRTFRTIERLSQSD